MAEAYSDNIFAEIETKPWDEVRALQEELLTEQLTYLAENSDYYQSQFREWDISPEDVQTMEDLAEVPFTTKDDERKNQETETQAQPLGPHQAVPRSEIARVLSSSGTTGSPTYFGLTDDDWNAWVEMCARAAYAVGVRPEDLWIHTAGRTMVPASDPYIEGIQKAGAGIIPAGARSTKQTIEIVEKFSVDGMFATTSYQQHLIDRVPEVVDTTVNELDLRKLLAGGEPGMANPEIRSEIYNEYGAERAAEVMGIGEVSAAVAAECQEEEGMHLVGQEYILPEIIDIETGEPQPMEAGTEGEMVYTLLQREATPLLRFRSGDYARVTGDDCSCGRTSPRIQIIGRADDMLIYKAQNVYPAGIRDVISEVEGAEPRIKVVLPHEDKVQFNNPIPVEIVRDGESDRSDDEIAAEAASRVRDELQVRIDPVITTKDDIELSTYKTDLIRVEETE